MLGEGEHHAAYHKRERIKSEEKKSQDLKIQPTTEEKEKLDTSEWVFAPEGLAAPSQPCLILYSVISYSSLH